MQALPMNDDDLDRIVKVLATQQVVLTAMVSLLQQLGVQNPQFKQTVGHSFRFFNEYKQTFRALLSGEGMTAEQEKKLWQKFGLGDLWGPSGPEEGSKG
jgi:hypothetical protein